jgi:Nuclease-related domain
MNENLVAKSIFIGAPIEHDSERKLLAATVQKLEEQHIPFIALANVQICGRQVDCIVATAMGVSVVEVKSSYLPVRGDLNGDWERFHATGEWRPYTNGYHQTLGAKNALRSAMTTVKPIGGFYPDGHVVFTSGLSEGSQLTNGDFKVAVVTLDEFLSSLNVQRSTPWSLNEWRVFAAKLGLRPVSISEAIASGEEQKAAEILRQYNEAVAAEYGKDTARWLPENTEQQENLLASAANGAGCFVTGASGWGKRLWRNGSLCVRRMQEIRPFSSQQRILPALGRMQCGVRFRNCASRVPPLC